MPKIKCEYSNPEHLCRRCYFSSNRRLVEWLLGSELLLELSIYAVTCADHTSLSLECSGWSCGGCLSTLSGIHLRARIAPSDRHELLDLLPLFPNSQLVLGWRLWFWFVCLLLWVFGGGKVLFWWVEIYFRTFMQYCFNMVKNLPVLPEHRYHWAKTPLSRHEEQCKSLFQILIPEEME